jgi:hypothetical protein
MPRKAGERKTMHLRDLNAKFLSASHEERLSFVSFDCPCGCAVGTGFAFTPALDGSAVSEARRPHTRISGSTIEDLTLSPSLLIYANADHGCKGWHGFLTNGELKSC